MTQPVVSQRAERAPNLAVPDQTAGEQPAEVRTPPGFWDDLGDAPVEPEPRPWSSHEVNELVSQYPRLSPMRVLGIQAVSGVLVALLGWLLTRHTSVVTSALYGAAAVVLPGLLLVHGMGGRPESAAAAQWRFLLWAFVKLGMACAMLAAASRIVPDLSWPALLVAMVVCLKVYAWALLWQRQVKKNT